MLLLFFFSLAGVIDEDYRGNVGVVLFNFGKEKFQGTLDTYNHINAVNFLSSECLDNTCFLLKFSLYRQDIEKRSIKYQ